MLRQSWSHLRWWGGVLGHHVLSQVRGQPRLPPGSLGPSSVVRLGDDRFFLNRSRKYGAVFTTLWSRKLAVCVIGLERGRRLLSAHSAVLRPRALEIDSFVPKGFLRRMRGDDHRRYRTGFLDAFRQDVPSAWDAHWRSILRAELGTLARLHATTPATPDQLAVALDRIAIRLLLVVCFGLPPGNPTFDVLETLFSRLEAWVYPRSPAQYAAFDELRKTVSSMAHEVAPESAARAGEGVLRRLARGTLGPTVDQTVVGNLIYMVDTGRYDMRSLFRWILKYLSDHPDVIAALRAPGAAADAVTPLAEACVLETLRLDQAESLNRDVLEDFTFEGYRIPKGSAVRILLRESHRDAETFPAPDEYRPCRFATRKYGSDAYAPFGIGEHRCIVGPLVVRLGAMLVEELVSGFEWSVAGDGPRHHGRYHWEPSPSFAIELRSRADLQPD